MKNMKNLLKGIRAMAFAIMIFACGGHIGSDVFALAENRTTIGDNAPMNRQEFEAWRVQRGIRFFNIEGQIYPAGIFFTWAQGQSFSYVELRGETLYVAIQTSAGNISISPDPDDELTAMIESVPCQNPMDTRSTITLPNRRLTEAKLAVWIDEYGEMGGVTAFELSVIREINRVRVQHRLKPLALDPALMLSARLKTQEFGDLQYFGHISPVHGNPATAARMFGFEGRRVSENITRTGSSGAPVFRTTPEGIVNGMLASTSGHREILLNPNATSVGFGAFFSPNSTGPNGRMSHMFYFASQFGFYD